MTAVDGNAIGGLLHEVFGTEMTGASSVCGHCGDGTGQPVQALGGHAVGAPQVAPVSDRHPQVGGDPAE